MARSVDLRQMREAVRSRLCERSAGHSERVAETARALAARNGVDEDAAELAGLLHDWHRDGSPDSLLEAAAAYSIDVLPVERLEPYLLHARLSEVELSREFPDIPAEVLDAIGSHTTGSVEMTPLQKVVYVADMIEPARHFDGVDALREIAASSDIDECFRRAYMRSVTHIVERRRPLHPVTVAVWNAHVAEVRS